MPLATISVKAQVHWMPLATISVKAQVHWMPLATISVKASYFILKSLTTRMHSSRMRTSRLLTVSCNGKGCLPRGGMSAGGGGCLPRGEQRWTELLTHACENITFPQLLLRTVKILKSYNTRTHL